MKYPIIKVCGMKFGDNIQAVLQTQPDWMGFIFYEHSPRNVSTSNREAIVQAKGVKKVGVFVNETLDNVLQNIQDYHLDLVQLHGQESPAFCELIKEKVTVIKAIAVNEKKNLNQTVYYNQSVDYFLFDTKKKGQAGGTGEQFDWSILKSYQGEVPFLLSGGISPKDVDQLKAFHHDLCVGIDLNSRFETQPGIKDASALRKFINKIKQV